MNTYKITIAAEVPGGELTGEFIANTIESAIEECKDIFANELGTYEEDIDIIKIEKQ